MPLEAGTISLTLLDRPDRLGCAVGRSASTPAPGRAIKPRRVLLRVGKQEPARQLVERIAESIVQLAGLPVFDRDKLAQAIYNDLRRWRWAHGRHRAWTLTYTDCEVNDPYAPPSCRLRLVDRGATSAAIPELGMPPRKRWRGLARPVRQAVRPTLPKGALSTASAQS